MQKNVLISLCISVALIGGTLYFITREPAPATGSQIGAEANNIEIKDGIQYVTVTAQGGYSPRTSIIKAGIPTKLIVKTNGTYDCSSSLVIREVGFQKILKPTGEETIDLGTPKSGGTIHGICGMGMFNFTIETS